MLHPNRRGQPWRFGMKLHIGVDGRRGLAQRMGVTAARRHDRPPLPELRQAHAQRVSAGSAWAGQQAQIAAKAPRVKDFTNPRIRKAAEVDARERKKNKTQSKLQARLAQAFGVLNRLWGLTQRRKRGLAKNAMRSVAAPGLADIVLARKRLRAGVRARHGHPRRPAGAIQALAPLNPVVSLDNFGVPKVRQPAVAHRVAGQV